MAHSIIPSPTSSSPISSRATHKTPPPLLGFQRNLTTHPGFIQAALHDKTITRRVFVWGLTGAALGLNAGQQSANAAKRRPPPPPPEEKKDPNVSGVLAKILASKKRKEAMKESVAKLRERGKTIDE
ncbi:uncharacterized protein LOC122654667 [Telopea speciosissima]|uniref:uncharacterized protein LOC122654667 n=1 Tax=Telopea speciosissima TaxID=54955 RepID=UPI001CC7D4DE|nr:uncharacterized protein LOC122654667 [Telopea speciosissima]